MVEVMNEFNSNRGITSFIPSLLVGVTLGSGKKIFLSLSKYYIFDAAADKIIFFVALLGIMRLKIFLMTSQLACREMRYSNFPLTWTKNNIELMNNIYQVLKII